MRRRAKPTAVNVISRASARRRHASLHMMLVATAAALKPGIVFTDARSKALLRLDAAGGAPQVIAHGIATYGGLVSWKGAMLAATESHKVIQVGSSGSSYLVDVPKAIGAEVVDEFSIGGMALCAGALFVHYGGNATAGHSGLLRCAGCELDTDCTSKCDVVDGGEKPGNSSRELGGFPAGVECLGDHVLVADNTNLRIQAVPASCPRSPCNVSTYSAKLDYPLGIAKVGDTLLVTLDSSIVSLSPDGSQHLWSKQGDSGYLVQGPGHSILVAHGDIVSFDSSCQGPDCKASVIWNATGGIEAYGAVAHI